MSGASFTPPTQPLGSKAYGSIGPLRKIVAVIRFSEGPFDPARVELECGHQVYSNGIYRARCAKCAAASPASASTPIVKAGE